MNDLEDRKYVSGGKWICLGIALLLLDIWLPFQFQMDRLSTAETITVAFDWFGMFSLILIINSCIRGRKSRLTDSFIRLVIVVFFILFFEVGTWTVDKLENHRMMNYLVNMACNSLMLVNIVFYFRFVCVSLDISLKKVSGLYRVTLAAAGIGILAEIINYWCGFFYVVDQNGYYHSNTIGNILGYIPFLFILGSSSVITLRQNIALRRKIDYLSYIVVPLGISIWYSITGMPPTLYLSSLISLLIIYGNIYVRQGQEMEQSLVENAKKDAELAWQRNQLTRSQIKPHFIFNCLGSIEQLCRIDAEKARIAMHRFAKYLRVNMDAMSEKALVPLSTELEHIQNYVWLEQMRFEDDLIYKEEIETTAFSLPPLSIQPIVENAIKHGMMGKEDGVLTVSVSVHETDGFYEIKVEDNGNGFDENQIIEDGRSHVGIQNVRESLAKTVNGEMMISSRIGHGTMVVILIPKESGTK